MPRRPTVYESGVDAWIAVMLMVTPAIAAVLGAYMLWIGKNGDALILLGTGVTVTVITVALTLPCRCTILDDALSIRCGLVCYQVPLDQIERIERSSTLLSGPALSMRRVLVITRKKRHILSPRERDEFMDDLDNAVKRAKE